MKKLAGPALSVNAISGSSLTSEGPPFGLTSIEHSFQKLGIFL
jgi:hypothetical protein